MHDLKELVEVSLKTKQKNKTKKPKQTKNTIKTCCDTFPVQIGSLISMMLDQQQLHA